MHPEAYGVAAKIVAACGRDVRTLMGDSAKLRALDPRTFVDERFGLPTVRDIIAELEKPGRDPRPEFKTASFADGVDDIKQLRPGMLLEGTVTNVAAFGAFVDIGVHQDGLVHVSQLADRFIKDAHEVVKAGDVVKVRVLEVDVPRKRISLTMRKDGGAASGRPAPEAEGRAPLRPDAAAQAGAGTAGRVRRRAGGSDEAEVSPAVVALSSSSRNGRRAGVEGTTPEGQCVGTFLRSRRYCGVPSGRDDDVQKMLTPPPPAPPSPRGPALMCGWFSPPRPPAH